MALADVWGDGVRSPCPSCSFVLTESGPACSGSVALAVPCHCALLDGGSLWMWEQKSHTQWSVGSHLTENIISIQSCSCCGSQRLSLLECFQGKQGNWIQSGAKIGELQGTDFLQVMLSPLWSHKIPCLNSRSSGNEGTMRTVSLWEIPGLMPVLTFTNCFSSNPKNHSLLEQHFHLQLKTSRFLIHHALVSCSICRKLVQDSVVNTLLWV